jgi:hypothetical protein
MTRVMSLFFCYTERQGGNGHFALMPTTFCSKKMYNFVSNKCMQL